MIIFALWVLGSTSWYGWSGFPRVGMMSVVGLAALAAGDVAMMLYRHRTGDANMRSVWVCSRNDAIGNLAVLLTAAEVFGTGSPDVIVAAIKQARAELRSRAVHLAVPDGPRPPARLPQERPAAATTRFAEP